MFYANEALCLDQLQHSFYQSLASAAFSYSVEIAEGTLTGHIASFSFLWLVQCSEWSWVDRGLLGQELCFQLLWASSWRGVSFRMGKISMHQYALDAVQISVEGCLACSYPDLVRNLTAATQVAGWIVPKALIIQGGKHQEAIHPKINTKLTFTTGSGRV